MKITDAQLAKCSYSDLLEMQNKITVALAQRKEQEKAAVKAKIAELAASSGFDVAELVGKKRGAAPGTKVASKYAHPKDPSKTWTGRGRKPLWLAAELDKGKKLESFSI